MERFILALDQGTTSSRAVLFNEKGEIRAIDQLEYPQIFTENGWVEHDPFCILDTQLQAAKNVIAGSGVSPESIAGIGITNQRETTVIWDKNTGMPVYNAIVWQCRRTAEICAGYKKQGLEKFFQDKTGLLIDPYFSATKIKWILDNVDGARGKAENGELLFGTVDSWLIWNLTGGAVHCTDYTNASRTMLFNIHTLEWDKEIMGLLGIPMQLMPEVVPSSGRIGVCRKDIFGAEIPITGCAGDQQAALFGQCCFIEGDVKNTYGTGGFLLMNTGKNPVSSSHGLLTTVAWGINGEVTYALEGSVFISGAVVKWLRDELGIIKTAAETEEIARSVETTGGVYVVPAFTGLGAPYWDPSARGAIVGLTRGSGKAHIVRACLEAIAYQTVDVLRAMEEDTKSLNAIKADGGACANNFLMQFQADILGRTVARPKNVESTATGAAYLAGLASGVWSSKDELLALSGQLDEFRPSMDGSTRKNLLNGWKTAVNRVRQG
ncbi:glycerol kinase GlpK [Ruminococcus sp. Marseille-P6503]|uniref:glycerol kinase GlpK n=1 Tax=Ruminococcus sp. Marseille-P6503 TaxID=2364796 RepID=UPI000F52EF91|nr:glycerol kinase GlpK [Ruminococcus sp. Marseille-P6503]